MFKKTNLNFSLVVALGLFAVTNHSHAQNSFADFGKALKELADVVQAGAPVESASASTNAEENSASRQDGQPNQQKNKTQLTLKDNPENFGFKKYVIGNPKSAFPVQNCRQLFQGNVGLFSVCDVKNSSDTMGGKPVNVDKLVFRDDLLAMVYVSHKFVPTNLGMTGIGLQADEVSKPIIQKYGEASKIKTSDDTAYESVTAICVNSCRHSIFLYDMPNEFYQVYGNINIFQKKLSEFTAVFAYSGAFDDFLATTNKIKKNARDFEQKKRVNDL